MKDEPIYIMLYLTSGSVPAWQTNDLIAVKSASGNSEDNNKRF